MSRSLAFRIARAATITAAAFVAGGAAGACGTSSAPAPGGFTVDDGGAGDDTGGGGRADATQGGDDGGGPGRFGGDAAAGDDGAVSSLFFQPASATVTVDGTAVQHASFTLMARDGSGNAVAVTPESIQFDRPDLATVADGLPVVATAPSSTSLYGGTGTVHAVYRGKAATASLTIRVQITDYGTGLGASSPGVAALGGASLPPDPAAGITPLLYPYDKTVWPLGLTSPLVMWNAPQAGDVYRLHYSEKNYVFDGYYTLGSLPGQLRLDQGAWDRITTSNDAKNGADPLTFTVSRWDHAANTAYLTSTQTWTVAPESLQGAIYYWTASQDAMAVRRGHISRFQPGTGATPQPLNNGKCMGCHAVNAQGTTLVADVDDLNSTEYPGGGPITDPSVAPYGNWSNTRPWAAFDVSQIGADAGAAPKLETNKYGADLALTPDGKYVVFGSPAPVAAGGSTVGTPATPGSKFLSLAPVATGDVIATSGLDDVAVDPGMGMMMPAFSPDGTKLAVVEAQYYADNVLPNAANPDAGVAEFIGYLDFDEASLAFKPTLHKVVDGSGAAFAGGRGLAYPSFSPDSTALAFHAGTFTTGCNANGCVDATPDDGSLFVATLAGAAPSSPVRLAAAGDPPDPNDGNASVEPTFNPVARGGYSWVVFTSMRAWGNVPWPAGTGAGHINAKRRLWVAAVDPAIGASDPSHPAIYLEGQEDTPNMRGFWTLAACVPSATGGGDASASCTGAFQCCSGFCQNGQCADISMVSCVGVGGSCTKTGDCCNPGSVVCQAGRCVVPVQ